MLTRHWSSSRRTPSMDPPAGRRLEAEKREGLRQAWADELDRARGARGERDLTREWRHLERAHILSQPLVLPHVRTHLLMLGAALRRRDRHEVTGQLLRLVLAGPGSVTGRYPVGNTGGADVSAFVPMTIPEDLRPLLDAERQEPVG